jgi:hypothetical protein
MAKKSDQLIEEFLGHVSKLADNLKAAVIEEAHAAFTGLASGKWSGEHLPDRGDGAKRRINRIGATPAPKLLAAPKGGRLRRNEQDIQDQLDAVVTYLKKAKEPTKAEVIGPALGLTTGQLQLTIALGLKTKVLAKKGKLRGTVYSVKS